VSGIYKYLETGVIKNQYKKFMQVYNIVINISDEHDKAKDLVDYFRRTCKNYIKDTIVPQVLNRQGPELIREFTKNWKNFTLLVYFLAKILHYLDRYYLKNANLQSLQQNALQLFNEQCFKNIQNQLRAAILDEIKKGRLGDSIDKELLKSCITLFVYMGYQKASIKKDDNEFLWTGDKNLIMYEKEFEAYLLKETQS
jgi:cullin 1